MSRVLVMGLGRFGGGAAVARHYAQRGHDVLVTDLAGRDRLRDSIAEIEPCGVSFRLGGHDPADFERAEIVAVNPAVPFDHPLVARARAAGASIVTELGLTLRLLRGPVVGVTGTNGKSTTASLLAEMLRASGVDARLGGNLGVPLLNEAPGIPPHAVTVLEISSFQLQWLEHRDVRFAAGVVTNVTGDHLDRHPSFEHYAAAKARLVGLVATDGTLVLNADDPVCRSYAALSAARVAWFGSAHPEPVSLDGLRLAGRHNRRNAAAAALAALALGADGAACARAARELRPLRHRLEAVAELHGVLCVDDSVSTTPLATAAAVQAFDRPVVLLVGGRDKGLDRVPLLRAARRARAVVAYGETGPDLRRALPGAALAADLDGAVEAGLSAARPGDVLLLSPGFSSYDQFPGFDARGRRFRDLLREAAPSGRPPDPPSASAPESAR